MIIKCRNKECGFDINIPDDKIPNKPVKITCPKCKAVTQLQLPQKEEGVENVEQTHKNSATSDENDSLEKELLSIMEEKLSAFKAEMMSKLSDSQGNNVDSKLFEEGNLGILTSSSMNKALICDDNNLNRKQIKDSLSKLGFISDEASTVDQAISLIDHIRDLDQHYKMIIIDKVFPDDDKGGYKILNEVASLPLVIRRKSFVAFVSAQLRTNDASTAFLMGANIVINKKDLPRLTDILKRETAHYENLYAVYNQCLVNRKKGSFR